MRDPSERPPLRLASIVEHLARHEVRWVLTGSVVLAACGAPIEPNDVDVTPELTTENLERLCCAIVAIGAIPAHVPEWPKGLTVDECRAWRSAPTEAGLDHLFVTDLGLLDVVPRLCGLYADLVGSAVAVQVRGLPVAVCDPIQVLQRLEGRTRPKDVERAEVYAKLRAAERPLRPDRLVELAARSG